MTQLGKFLYHLTAAAVLGYGIYYDTHVVSPPQEYLDKSIKFAGRWKYLTFIDANIQCWYFIFSLVNDLFGSDTNVTSQRSTLQKVRDAVFACLAFPLGAFVCATFWILFCIDRNMVYPEELDSFIPVWLNHIMHTSILPFAIVELVICPHKYPSIGRGLLRSGLAMLSYALWTFFIAFHTGFWVYPLLAMLNWTYRILFILGCMAFAMLCYLIGHALNNVIWKFDDQTSKKNKKAKKQ